MSFQSLRSRDNEDTGCCDRHAEVAAHVQAIAFSGSSGLPANQLVRLSGQVIG